MSIISDEQIQREAADLPEHVRNRMGDAIEAAEQTFWREIAIRFPEIKTGDVDPGWVMRREENNIRDLASWLSGNMPMVSNHLVVGSRIELAMDVDRRPHFVAPEGSRGTVTHLQRDLRGRLMELCVQIDMPLPGSEDWDNCIQWGGENSLDGIEEEIIMLGVAPGSEFYMNDDHPRLAGKRGVILGYPKGGNVQVLIFGEPDFEGLGEISVSSLRLMDDGSKKYTAEEAIIAIKGVLAREDATAQDILNGVDDIVRTTES